jgi:hypothetical protein
VTDELKYYRLVPVAARVLVMGSVFPASWNRTDEPVTLQEVLNEVQENIRSPTFECHKKSFELPKAEERTPEQSQRLDSLERDLKVLISELGESYLLDNFGENGPFWRDAGV